MEGSGELLADSLVFHIAGRALQRGHSLANQCGPAFRAYNLHLAIIMTRISYLWNKSGWTSQEIRTWTRKQGLMKIHGTHTICSWKQDLQSICDVQAVLWSYPDISCLIKASQGGHQHLQADWQNLHKQIYLMMAPSMQHAMLDICEWQTCGLCRNLRQSQLALKRDGYESLRKKTARFCR